MNWSEVFARHQGVILGTSGWQYKSWTERFYEGIPQKRWLEAYVESFATVELNNSFYRLPKPETFTSWYERTPDDFVFTVKMSRYLSHIKRLKDPQEPIERFMTSVSPLQEKLGPILLQLPPNMGLELERLEETLSLFPEGLRVAVEFRHPDWFVDETRSLLEKYGAALSWADSPRRETPTWKTADWGYLRLHEGTARPKPCYSRPKLRRWVDNVIDTFDESEAVYVYFNNDPNVCAVRDAGWFHDLVVDTGRSCTRAEGASAVKPIQS